MWCAVGLIDDSAVEIPVVGILIVSIGWYNNNQEVTGLTGGHSTVL